MNEWIEAIFCHISPVIVHKMVEGRPPRVCGSCRSGASVDAGLPASQIHSSAGYKQPFSEAASSTERIRLDLLRSPWGGSRFGLALSRVIVGCHAVTRPERSCRECCCFGELWRPLPTIARTPWSKDIAAFKKWAIFLAIARVLWWKTSDKVYHSINRLRLFLCASSSYSHGGQNKGCF